MLFYKIKIGLLFKRYFKKIVDITWQLFTVTAVIMLSVQEIKKILHTLYDLATETHNSANCNVFYYT